MVNQQELIDQYHSGQMSPEGMIDFEKQLASNPEMKAESDFQSEIINGLKEVRKAELKSRLNAIEIGSGWMEFAMQSSLVKSFGGVALATLIGSAVYLYAEKKNPIIQSSDPIVVSMPSNDLQGIDIEVEDLATIQLRLNEAEAKIETPSLGTDESVTPISSIKSTNPIEKNDTKSVTKPSEFVHEFSAPNANVIEEDTGFESINLDELPEAGVLEEKEIDVVTENVKSVKIQYRYYDGKLFLSGDFDKSPYEILEINSANGRRIYIKYLDAYYQVKSTDKLSDLPEVTDQKLITELKLLKENK